jgi:O-acetylhomoserine/O-acetylserine sulfhydrylase-like pyridoxal-dependent enzyme
MDLVATAGTRQVPSVALGDCYLSDTNPTPAELDERIAVLEDNLRDLIEQGAAYSGAGDEDRSADRIAELEQQIEALKDQREQRA